MTLNSCNSTTPRGSVSVRQGAPPPCPSPRSTGIHSPDSRSSPASFHTSASRWAVVMATGRWGAEPGKEEAEEPQVGGSTESLGRPSKPSPLGEKEKRERERGRASSRVPFRGGIRPEHPNRPPLSSFQQLCSPAPINNGQEVPPRKEGGLVGQPESSRALPKTTP